MIKFFYDFFFPFFNEKLPNVVRKYFSVIASNYIAWLSWKFYAAPKQRDWELVWRSFWKIKS